MPPSPSHPSQASLQQFDPQATTASLLYLSSADSEMLFSALAVMGRNQDRRQSAALASLVKGTGTAESGEAEPLEDSEVD